MIIVIILSFKIHIDRGLHMYVCRLQDVTYFHDLQVLAVILILHCDPIRYDASNCC